VWCGSHGPEEEDFFLASFLGQSTHLDWAPALVDRGLDPQQAIEAPRVFAFRNKLRVERAVAEPIIEDLRHRGHDIDVATVPLGGCQAIWIDHERGVLIGGSEPRNDGVALGY